MSTINYLDTLDDWEEIERRSQNQLTKDDGYVPWGTNLVEGAKDLAGRAVGQLQEWAKEDPDTWTDDVLRLMGRGVEGAGSAMADWESRSEEGELGLRSAAGTVLRFMNWSSEQGARLGRTGARALGVNEELGGFLGSFLPEAIGTKGLSKAAQVARSAKQIQRLNKAGYAIDVGRAAVGGGFGAAPITKAGRALKMSGKQHKALRQLAKDVIPEGWNSGRFKRFANKMGDGVQEALVAHDDALKYYKANGNLRGRPGGNIWHNPANNKYYLIKNKAASGKPPILGFDDMENVRATAAKRASAADLKWDAVENAAKKANVSEEVAKAYFDHAKNEKKVLKMLIKNLNVDAGRQQWSLGHRRAVKAVREAGEQGADRALNIELEPLINMYDKAGNLISRGNAGRAATDELADILSVVTNNPRNLVDELKHFSDNIVGNYWPRMGDITDVKSFVRESGKRDAFLNKVTAIAKQNTDNIPWEQKLREAAEDVLDESGAMDTLVSQPTRFPELSNPVYQP